MVGTREAADEIRRIRQEIDAIDDELLELLNRRADLALAIRALKAQVDHALYDPKREQEILDRLCAANEGPLYPQNVQEVYGTILKIMKEVPEA